MKIPLVIFLFVIGCRIELVAQTYQYHPLVDSSVTKEWQSYCFFYTSMGEVFLGDEYLMTTDTIVNGFRYRQIWSVEANVNGGNAYVGGLLEDSLKKVYFKVASSPGDTSTNIGNLIFDFSLNVNDSFNYCRLQSIDTILVGQEFRKKFTFSPIQYETTNDIWIEGLGSVYFGLGLETTYCHIENSNLCKVFDGSSLVYSHTNALCPFSSVINTTADEIRLSVYPDPLTDVCNIELGGGQLIFKGTILDLTGRSVMPLAINVASSKFSFNSSPLNAGIYFLEVSSTSGKNAVVKFVKE